MLYPSSVCVLASRVCELANSFCLPTSIQSADNFLFTYANERRTCTHTYTHTHTPYTEKELQAMYQMMGVAGGRAEAYAKLQGQVPVDTSEESAALHLGVTRLFHVGHVLTQD